MNVELKNDEQPETPQVVMLPMEEIFHDSEFNCRGKLIPFNVIELAKNIQENGLIQPIIVQPYDRKPPFKWRVVAGYRRHLAHVVNRATHIASIVREGLSDTDAKFLNLSENLNREDLDLMQEARVLNQFFEQGMTQQAVADRLNKSRTWVQNRVYAMRLPAPIQEEIKNGVLKSEHIHALKGETEERQYEIVREIKERREKDGGRVKLSKKMVKKDPKAVMLRDKSQITKMRDHIIDSIGVNIGTRALAWAEGNISSADMFETIKEEAEERGIIYFPPTEDL